MQSSDTSSSDTQSSVPPPSDACAPSISFEAPSSPPSSPAPMMQRHDDWLPQAFGCGTAEGCGGFYKRTPEDFVVEEIPAYEPSGAGEHLYLWVEKTRLSTAQLIEHASRTFGVSQRDIGVAGNKDTFAVTRQMLSLPARNVENPEALNNDQVRVLRHALHGNKLKTGHLRGNRFTIVLRETNPDALEHARAVAERFATTGVPNFFGEQRFGREGQTVFTGLAILRGEKPPVVRGGGGGRMRRLALSSVQSALFNRYLNERVRDGSWQTVLDGEVLQVCASGGPFTTDDVAREQARFEAREVVPAGPIFGPKMRKAEGVTLAREAALLSENGCDMDSFAGQGKLMQGTRRPLVVWPQDVSVSAHEDGVALAFTLPPGSYATVVLREFQGASEPSGS